MLARYLRDGTEPEELPADFWLTTVPPAFVPPPGVRRAVITGRAGAGTTVRLFSLRSLPATVERGVLLVPDEVTFLDLPRFPAESRVGGPPPDATEATAIYEDMRRRWWTCWERAADARRSASVPLAHVDVDRARALRDYHRWFERPGGLPPWYFDVEPMPPFEPPTNLTRLDFGDVVVRDGRAWTELIRSGGWISELEWKRPRLVRAKRGFDWVEGAYRRGDFEDSVELADREWRRAVTEWEERYRACRGYRGRFAGG
jgi:hypothetical protein